MVTPDPLDNDFYVLSPQAREQWLRLSARGHNLFKATMRPLEMGTTLSSPFVHPSDPPIAGADRYAQMPQINFHVYFRPPADNTPIQVTHIEPAPD